MHVYGIVWAIEIMDLYNYYNIIENIFSIVNTVPLTTVLETMC